MRTPANNLTPPYADSYTWRPLTRADSPALHRFYIQLDLVDKTAYAGTLQDTQDDFDDPHNQPETNSIAAFMPDGEIAAMGWVLFNPEARAYYTPYLWGGVVPTQRRKGLGSFVMSWSEARANQILAELNGSLPKSIRTNARPENLDKIALLEQYSFSPRRYFLRMRRSLHQPLPELPNLGALKVEAFHPEISRAVLDSKNEAFEDHWHAEATEWEAWQRYFTGSASFHPEISFQILDGGEVAAGSIARIRAEDNARANINEGWINLLWVRRPWRGRGLGKYILIRSMQAFKEAGLDCIGLSVDGDSPTGAVRLYENVGFEQVDQNIAYFKDFVPLPKG